MEIHLTDHNIVFVAAIGQAFNLILNGVFSAPKMAGRLGKRCCTLLTPPDLWMLNLCPPIQILFSVTWRAGVNRGPLFREVKKMGFTNPLMEVIIGLELENGLPDGIVGKIDLAVSPLTLKFYTP
ncbi:MAG: hypothetical protein R2788_14485 [Saprospiraceae bacterium]